MTTKKKKKEKKGILKKLSAQKKKFRILILQADILNICMHHAHRFKISEGNLRSCWGGKKKKNLKFLQWILYDMLILVVN